MKRILIVDDDPDDISTFSDAIAELHLDLAVDQFEDGYDALSAVVSKQVSLPNIILLDVNMPVLNGWECLKRIKEMAVLERIPIVMYSTADIRKTGVHPADVGAADFLVKPDIFLELKKQLHDLFRKHLDTPSLA